tara:strand:+ start:103 stop:579 length:477 start_codon:yes stop_codon:yes gene_type:complete
MHPITIYAELHSAVRRPNLEFYLNNQPLLLEDCKIVRFSQFQENIIFHLTAESLLTDNVLQIIMKDKTDNDIINVNGKYSDHCIKIKEIAIDDIKFQTILFKVGRFEHSMPNEWVDEMNKKGYQIEPCYINATDINLNGTLTINFSTPLWEWWCNHYE